MKKLSVGLILAAAACGGPVGEEATNEDAVIMIGGSIPRIPIAPPFKLRFPIHSLDRALISGAIITGQDHNASTSGTVMACTNYEGFAFPFCYNQHDGTDFLLIGGFPQMDRWSPRVVAAAPGIVERVIEDAYDRCSADAQVMDVSCHGHPMVENKVVIRHDNGWSTEYLHLKTNSVPVIEGQAVSCGQEIGLIGSSGHSSMPHLHFALKDPYGNLVDPYAGPFSQATSYWWVQEMADGLPGDLCYNQVDATVCATRWVSEVSSCGTTLATNAALCGTEVVASASACGTQWVTSGAQCGYDLVTSASQCGTSWLTSLSACAARGFGFFGGGCSVPNTCNVPRSCNVALTCTVADTCEVANSCQVWRCD